MTILYIDQTGQLGGGELSLLDWLSVSAEGARVVLFEDGPFRPRLEELGIPVRSPIPAFSKRNSARIKPVPDRLPAAGIGGSAQTPRQSGASMLTSSTRIPKKAFLLAAIAKQPGQPLIWHLRDILSAEHFHPILRKIAVTAGNRFATSIIVNSQATAEAFIAAGGNAAKIRVVPDGVSAEALRRCTARGGGQPALGDMPAGKFPHRRVWPAC